jgi:radical SAM protein with 4Fe4S-binding SPASM domain
VPVKYWKYLLYCAQGIAFGQINYLGEVKNCASLSVGIGNIFEDDLSNIWEKKLANFRTFKHLPLSCRLCPVFCGGGCIASRTMKQNFIADEFIKLPAEESFLESIFITLKNYFKKWIFQAMITPKAVKNKKVDKYPLLSKQYKIRRESENCYVGLFDGKGMLTFDQFGADVIALMDGKNSLEDIGSVLRCPAGEVEDFIRTVI